MPDNQDTLRARYLRNSNDYNQKYQDYLTAKYATNPDTGVVTQLAREVSELDSKLKSVISQIKTQESNIGQQLFDTSAAIERKTFSIYDKSKNLDIQQDEIARKKDELYSKQKQIEMGIQKNKYRRNVIIVLIIVNILMILAIFAFYMSVPNN
jgi:hypothetical protein